MTTDCVVDASALVIALVGRSGEADALRAQLPSLRLHAPHLIDAEVGNVLRRHELAGLISTPEADAARIGGRWLVAHRYPHIGALADGAWELRQNLTFYDALYVALASSLGIPFITADTRLAHAPGLPCEIELV